MPANLLDMAVMTVSGTPGAGAITLLAASTGYQTFATAGAVSGRVYSYMAKDGSVWEIGRGTYSSSGPTLTRSTVLTGSSGAGVAVSLTSAATVQVVLLAEDIEPAINRPHSWNGCAPVP